MDQTKTKAPLDIASQRLREIALEKAEGEFIGSEDDLLGLLEVARVTARQAARLLEREGLVKVRRGTNGGYFAARPDPDMIVSVVCGYLNTLGLGNRHTGGVATALWVETVREAASADRNAARAAAEELSAKIILVTEDTEIGEIGRLEQEIRQRLFELIGGGYIQLLFKVNATFSRQQISQQAERGTSEGHQQFIKAWRRAKLMELDAIADGDQTLAILAATHTRNLWTSLDPESHKQISRPDGGRL